MERNIPNWVSFTIEIVIMIIFMAISFSLSESRTAGENFPG